MCREACAICVRLLKYCLTALNLEAVGRVRRMTLIILGVSADDYCKC